jgi:hypothetical protein
VYPEIGGLEGVPPQIPVPVSSRDIGDLTVGACRSRLRRSGRLAAGAQDAGYQNGAGGASKTARGGWISKRRLGFHGADDLRGSVVGFAFVGSCERDV